MAHVKAGGTSRLGRDSESKRLGVKLFGGQSVKAGQIIVRQRGTKMLAGEGTALGKDHTIHASIAGKVDFQTKRKTSFSSSHTRHTLVSVKPD